MKENGKEQMPEIGAFVKRYAKRIDDIHEVQNKIKRASNREKWQSLLQEQANMLKDAYRENEEEVKTQLYPYINGEVQLNEQTAKAHLDGLIEVTQSGHRDALLNVMMAKCVVEYYAQHFDRDYYLQAMNVYAFHLDTFMHVDNPTNNEVLAQEMYLSRECFARSVEEGQHFDTLCTQRAKDAVVSAYANLVVCQDPAVPDSTAEKALEYYDKMLKFLADWQLLQDEVSGQKNQAKLVFAEDALINNVLMYNLPSGEESQKRVRALAERRYQEELAKHGDPMKVNYLYLYIHLRETHSPDLFEHMYAYFKKEARACVDAWKRGETPDFTALFDLSVYTCDAICKEKDRSKKEKERIADALLDQLIATVRCMPQNAGMYSQDEFIWPCVYKMLTLLYTRRQQERLILSFMVFRQVETSLHVMMVARITDEITAAILNTQPELFVGYLGAKSVEEVLARRKEFEEYAHNCAQFHDLGKTRIMNIINMQYRRLTDYEFSQITMHPLLGATMLKHTPSLERYSDVALGHHKFYDGSRGYPADFDNRNSPYAVFIDLITVADSIDAATDHLGRCYSRAKTFDEVYQELIDQSGTHYSPDIVGVLEKNADLRACLTTMVREGRVEMCYRVYQAFIHKEEAAR